MKGRSIIGLILSLLVIIGTCYIAYFGIGANNAGGAKDITLGLDLEGGVSITYKTEVDNPSDQELDDTVYKIQKRISGLGYTESEVYKEGNNRINVDIPGATDANQVLEELGKPGKIEFIDVDGNVVISGDDVKDASFYKDSSDFSSPYKVSLELNDEGAEKFSQATAANIGKPIAIVYNGETLMSPIVQDQITNGVASISGLDTLEEASAIASTIRIGALPLQLEELRSNVVGAKMGQDAIDTSLKAALVGIIIIFLFMIVFYRVPGFAASLALAFYASLTIVCISIFNITLTLPGIAGIVLSVGMAVDANVIIFSRIREELAMEKTLLASVRAGFKKATSAILDGNITTLIAAAVLFLMGTGTIKGFATTLALGIIISMFTALVVTRIVLYGLVNLGLKNKKLYGQKISNKPIPVIELKKIWFSISIAAIIIGIVALPINYNKIGSALNYDVEFAGGTSTLVTLGEGEGYSSYEELETDIQDIVVEATGDETPQFKNVKGTDQFIITTSELSTSERIALEEALADKYGISSDNIESETISPTISTEMQRDALIAIIISAIFILLYITLRFKDVRFGISAVIALVHDILIVLAVYAVLREPINNSFVAVMLTIVGYSINDTIVLFDRVRENQKHMKRGDFNGVVNLSVGQTLSRSINTSLTTFIMVFSLYIIGVASIKEFALPLMVGIISGTYSSIFIASPLWYIFKKKEERKIQTATSNQ